MDLEDLKSDVADSIKCFDKECDRTAKLLRILKRKPEKFFQQLNSSNADWCLHNMHYINDERNFQDLIQKKLMDVNADLEKFCRTTAFAAEPHTNYFDKACLNSIIIHDENKSMAALSANVIQAKTEPFDSLSEEEDVFDLTNETRDLSINDKESMETPVVEPPLPIELPPAEEAKPKCNDVLQKVINSTGSCKVEKKRALPKPDLSFKFNDDQSSLPQGYTKPKLETSTNYCLTLKPKEIPPIGSLCEITFFKSPNDFYLVVYDSDYENLQKLNNQLTTTFDNSECPFANKDTVKEHIDKFCIAFSDYYKGWFRAAILDFLPESTDCVLVQFIDYGDQEEVEFKNLRVAESNFAEVPVIAQKCHLAYLYPPTSNPDTLLTEWPAETIATLQQMVISKCFSLTFALKDADMNSLAVDLHPYAKDANPDLTVGSYMLENRLAVEIVDGVTIETQPKREPTPEPMKPAKPQGSFEFDTSSAASDSDTPEFFLKKDTTIEASNVNEAVTEYDPQDDRRICKFIMSRGFCPKRNCLYEHKRIPKGALTADQQEVFVAAKNELALPREGEEIWLIVRWVHNAYQFYGNIVHDQCEQTEDPIICFQKQINNKSTVKTYHKLKIMPSKSQIVLVTYNDIWFRGRVVDYATNDADMLNVFLVDFGDEIVAELCDLREITVELLHFPFQAVKCHISDVCLNVKTDILEGKTYFETLYLGQILRAKVTASILNYLEVTLFDSDNVDVTSILAKNGYIIRGRDLSRPKSSYLLVD